MRKIPNLRWWIAGLLFFASLLNYIDRQTLSILAPTIQQELGLTDQQYGNVVSWFLAAYTLSYLLSGRVVDALGTRASMAFFVCWWSAANALTGFAKSYFSLSAFRALLGFGEAGGYTASPQVVAEWFPPRDRGVAVGLYSVGGAIGATLAPIVIIWITETFGWRWAFALPSLLGFIFVILWVAFFRAPSRHPLITESELAATAAATPAEESDSILPLSESGRWRAILASPVVWSLMAARLLTDPVWYFFQFWMPKYLHTVRGLDQKELAQLWIIFVAAAFGGVGSGFFSGALIRSGYTAGKARLRIMLFAALVVPVAASIPTISGTSGALAISAVVVLAQMAWLASISTYVVDVVPKAILGTAFGFIAAGSALGGILMNYAIVWAIGHLTYDVCFYAMVILHPLAFAVVWIFARRPWVLAPQ